MRIKRPPIEGVRGPGCHAHDTPCALLHTRSRRPGPRPPPLREGGFRRRRAPLGGAVRGRAGAVSGTSYAHFWDVDLDGPVRKGERGRDTKLGESAMVTAIVKHTNLFMAGLAAVVFSFWLMLI